MLAWVSPEDLLRCIVLSSWMMILNLQHSDQREFFCQPLYAWRPMLCLATIATHGREHCEVFKSCWCSTSLMCSDQNALGAAIPEGSLAGAFVLKELHLNVFRSYYLNLLFQKLSRRRLCWLIYFFLQKKLARRQGWKE